MYHDGGTICDVANSNGVSLGSPPHSWCDVPGEGSSSLNYLLSHLLVHQNYSTQMVDHQW